MRMLMLASVTLGLVLAACAQSPQPVPAAPPAPAFEGTLDDIIARYEAFELAGDPARAADEAGRAPDRWGDVTPETRTRRGQQAAVLLADLANAAGADPVDRAILEALLRYEVLGAERDLDRIPFTGDYGFHAEPVFAALRLRIESVEDADAWISRLDDTRRYFGEHIANMRRGISTGFTSHGDPLAVTIEQVREQTIAAVTDSDLYVPILNMSDTIPAADRARIEADAQRAVAGAIAAYTDLLTFLETEYAPQARPDPGLVSLPDGRGIYADLVAHHTAGAGLTPPQVHEIGRNEVARIRAEMEAIIDEIGFAEGFAAFLDFLRTDQRFYADSPADLLEKAAEISKRLDTILPRYFGRLPRLPYGVSPVPASIAPGFTTGRYVQGDAENQRPGTYLVNTYRLDQRPLYELPALSAHEAVPGHHLQIALAQELSEVPEYRRLYYATAFGEGWGLYAERLAGEAGIYRTPYERFGALSYEMWRACRLVSDTGLHWYGWSREEAEACFAENSALSPLNIQTEVTRYIGWPGQATAYKIGELRILALRDQARDTLGADFDIRAFHDHLLGAGSMPLSVLEDRMESWTQDQVDAIAPLRPAPAP
ncbi:MAG: DUF885 domain-containing protein [Pseudomonadota bacterium]